MAGFPTPDEVFEGRYKIISVINRGGFGRVYRARQLKLNRDVAIKILQPIMRDGAPPSDETKRLEVVKKRFEREAQLVSQLRNNQTVVMHDYGTTEDGLLYMVLEYIDGHSLKTLIEREGPFEPERAVRIAKQVLWSLQEAHALNMLHRDIKPHNIMVFDRADRADRVKVLDFGLAKSAESADFLAEDPDLTGDQVILGTPRYMAPEQIRGERLGPPADIYALGLVMVEMLTGEPAVSGELTMNTLARHLNEVPITLPEDVQVPRALRDLINQMLHKDATMRVQTVQEALDVLEFWNSGTSLYTPQTHLADKRRRERVIWVSVAVLIGFFIFAIVINRMPKPATLPEMPDARPAQPDRVEIPRSEFVHIDPIEDALDEPPPEVVNVAVPEPEPEPQPEPAPEPEPQVAPEPPPKKNDRPPKREAKPKKEAKPKLNIGILK